MHNKQHKQYDKKNLTHFRMSLTCSFPNIVPETSDSTLLATNIHRITSFITFLLENPHNEKIGSCLTTILNMCIVRKLIIFMITCYLQSVRIKITHTRSLYAAKMMGPCCDPSVHYVIGLHRLIMLRNI